MKLWLLFARIVALMAAASILLGCVSAPKLDVSADLQGDYILDPAHTRITWSVSHAGLSRYTARFDVVSGQLVFDAKNPELSRLDIRIDPSSVSTGLPKFDQTLAFDSKYFDAKKYPEIRFVSVDIAKLSDSLGKVTGDLTFRGQTHSVTLDVIFNGSGKSFGHPGQTLGFSATSQLSRSEFGLTYLSNLGIGDEVELRIETEFNEARN